MSPARRAMMDRIAQQPPGTPPRIGGDIVEALKRRAAAGDAHAMKMLADHAIRPPKKAKRK